MRRSGWLGLLVLSLCGCCGAGARPRRHTRPKADPRSAPKDWAHPPGRGAGLPPDRLQGLRHLKAWMERETVVMAAAAHETARAAGAGAAQAAEHWSVDWSSSASRRRSRCTSSLSVEAHPDLRIWAACAAERGRGLRCGRGAAVPRAPFLFASFSPSLTHAWTRLYIYVCDRPNKNVAVHVCHDHAFPSIL